MLGYIFQGLGGLSSMYYIQYRIDEINYIE